MKYAVEMGSGAMLYVPEFIKIGSDIEKLLGGLCRQHGEHRRLLLFFKSK
jgi:hypothetical protein